MDMQEIFKNGCFSPGWIEKDAIEATTEEKDEVDTQSMQAAVESAAPILKHKDLSVLLGELEEIKNNIENIKAKQWHLAKLIKYHEEGFTQT